MFVSCFNLFFSLFKAAFKSKDTGANLTGALHLLRKGNEDQERGWRREDARLLLDFPFPA
jgi:hypothetical protein